MTVSTEHIQVTPGVCGGKPRIAGTRIRVQDVVIWHRDQGQSADVIVQKFSQVTFADVHAALAYYHDHREEIDGLIERERTCYEELKRSQPSLVDTLKARGDARTTPDSSR